MYVLIYKTTKAPYFYFSSTFLFLINNSEMDILHKKENIALGPIIEYLKRANRIDMKKM